jgi:type II restriction enzyme
VFNKNKPNLSEILLRKRNIEKIPVKLPNGKPLELSLGEHNVLQKAIIEEFLPRYGSDCSVLYIGDTSNKSLHIETEELKKLNFFETSVCCAHCRNTSGFSPKIFILRKRILLYA